MISQNKSCPSCGAEALQSASFCSRCGAAFSGESADLPEAVQVPSLKPSPQPTTYGSSRAQRRGFGGLPVATIVLLVFAAFAYPIVNGACGMMASMSRDPAETRSKIRIGMSKREVTEAIGEPDRVQSISSSVFGDRETRLYGRVTVTFEGDNVSSIGQF